MSMSGAYGALNDHESIATLHRAVELGVTLFDTADVYGPFANEAFIAHALRPVRDRVLYATKFGLVRTSAGQHIGVNGTPAYVKRSCELSLQRLGTDRIDLYLQHRVDPTTPIEDTVGAMAELVAEGKVRHIGLSEASGETIRRAHSVHPISVVQSEYSLWSRDVEEEVLPTCRELGIAFIAYSPLGRGFLTGAIGKASDLAPGDYRLKDPRFQGEAFDVNAKLVALVARLADEIGCTRAQLALAWVLARGDDIVPIPGTKRRATLEQNLGAVSIRLSADHARLLDEHLPPGATAGERYADMTEINPVVARKSG
jgi:aryl-alcohol dehydrogenase-like predicted oxidoreductase